MNVPPWLSFDGEKKSQKEKKKFNHERVLKGSKSKS